MFNKKTSVYIYAFSFLLFGFNPLIIRLATVPSDVMTFVKGFFAVITLLIIYKITNTKMDFKSIKNNLRYLIISGITLGVNCALIFEAYSVTKIAVASLLNNLAPVIIVAISPFVLKTRLKLRQVFFIATTFLGVLLLSGALSGELYGANLTGVILAGSAAVCYVINVICVRKMEGVAPLDNVTFQMIIMTVIVFPYTLIKNGGFVIPQDGLTVFLMIASGVVTTGIAFYLYYGALPLVPVFTIGVLPYLEPVTSVTISFLVLRERLSLISTIGAVMILASAVANEVFSHISKKEMQ